MRLASYDESDPHFVRDLRKSVEACEVVASWLNRHGFVATVKPLKIRPNAESMRGYSDDGDIAATTPDGRSIRVEVKHRGIRFTGEGNRPYPFPTVIVDVAHAWENANPKPAGYVITNPEMTVAAVVSSRTAAQWVRVRKFDVPKQRWRTFYEAPLSVVRFRKLDA